MKTMIRPYPDKMPDWWIPKLHAGLAPSSADWNEMRDWLEENCREPFYMYPSWTKKIGAEFEDDEEAVRFTVWARLRFG